jgi:hypothetical protein
MGMNACSSGIEALQTFDAMFCVQRPWLLRTGTHSAPEERGRLIYLIPQIVVTTRFLFNYVS